MNQFAIFPNRNRDEDFAYFHKIAGLFSSFGATILVEDTFAPQLKKDDGTVTFLPFPELVKAAQIGVVLGGDGTLISAARRLCRYNLPIFGVNLGHLGFLSELEREDLSSVQKLFRGEYTIEKRMMLDVSVWQGTNKVQQFLALNDAVVSRGRGYKMIHCKLYADDEFVIRYPADGIAVSTPTGSTAYSLSAGGPVLEPQASVLLTTPVCPHTLHARPMVFGDKRTLTIEITGEPTIAPLLSVDGQETLELSDGMRTVVKKSRYHTKLVSLSGRSFYDVLREKLTENKLEEL